MIHCFSDVGIWASLGKHENLNRRFKKSCEIVMRAEHEIGMKSCRNWHKIVMHAEHENLNRGLKNRNGESGVV